MKRLITLAVAGAAVLALAAVAVTGASGAPAKTAASKSPYVLGSITDLTGTFSSSDAGGALGIKAWAQYVNAHGGINGHPVKLTVKDAQGNPSTALTLVKQFAADKKVLALVGSTSSVETVFAPVASAAGLPIVGEFPAFPDATTVKGVFPQGTTSGATLYGETYVAIKLAKVKKVAAFYCAEVPSCSTASSAVKATAKSLGGEMVNAQGIPGTAPNYDAQCTAAQKAGAQGIVMALGASTILSVAESCASVGFKPKYIIQTTALTPQEGQSSAMKNSTFGVVETFPWVSAGTPAQKAFQAGVKAARIPAGQLNAAVSLGWTSGALFQAAMAKAGNNPTRASIMNALWSLPKKTTLGGLSPPLTYKRNAPSPEVKCFFVMKLAKGKWTAPYGPTKTFCQP